MVDADLIGPDAGIQPTETAAARSQAAIARSEAARRRSEAARGRAQAFRQSGRAALARATAASTGPGAHDRDRLADERDRRADEREVAADERDRLADARDRVADSREAAADRREHRADERERLLDERQQSVDQTGVERTGGSDPESRTIRIRMAAAERADKLAAAAEGYAAYLENSAVRGGREKRLVLAKRERDIAAVERRNALRLRSAGTGPLRLEGLPRLAAEPADPGT